MTKYVEEQGSSYIQKYIHFVKKLSLVRNDTLIMLKIKKNTIIVSKNQKINKSSTRLDSPSW